MTRRTLHSAVLEVGLFYEKRWPKDRIAWFTQHLTRRRLREQAAAARAQKAAAAPPSAQLQPAAGIAFPISSRDALVDQVRADLSRTLSDAERADAQEWPEESLERAAPTRAG